MGFKKQQNEDVHPSEQKTSSTPTDFEKFQALVDQGYDNGDLDPDVLRQLKKQRRRQHDVKKIWTTQAGGFSNSPKKLWKGELMRQAGKNSLRHK